MKFATVTINISTRVKEGSPLQTTVLTLTESEVDDNIVAQSLISGQSPRVAIQGNWRRNGIPKEQTMPWAEFIKPGRSRVATQQLTPEQMMAALLSDPEKLNELLRKNGYEVGEQVETDETE